MINLPKDWVKGVRLDEDDFRIFTIGRFKLYQPINEQILILLDTKLIGQQFSGNFTQIIALKSK